MTARRSFPVLSRVGYRKRKTADKNKTQNRRWGHGRERSGAPNRPVSPVEIIAEDRRKKPDGHFHLRRVHLDNAKQETAPSFLTSA